jgi:hypothetical protein
MNLAAGKTYGFGERATSAGALGPRAPKCTAELWVLALNVLNHPNLTQPVAVLGTPLFGRSVGVVSGGSLSPARAFDLQFSVSF